MWRLIESLIIKELLLLWRDRRSRLALLLPPFMQLFVFSYAATYDVTSATLAILNRDGGQASRELVSRVAGAPLFRGVIYARSEAELRALIDQQHSVVALSIDSRFSAALARGEPARLQLLMDGRRSNAAQILQGYLQAIVQRYGAEIGVPMVLAGAGPSLTTRHWFNPRLESLWVVVPALVGILTMLITMIIGAISLARERELGTLEQLLVTPLQPWQIMLGKLVPAVLVGMIEGVTVTLISQTWFGVPLIGPLWVFFIGLACFIWSVVGVGVFISIFTRTQQQALVGVMLFTMPCVILSGFIAPVENMPEWLQWLTMVNPLRYFYQLVHGVFLRDAPLLVLWHSLWPLLLIGMLTLALAARYFRRRLY